MRARIEHKAVQGLCLARRMPQHCDTWAAVRLQEKGPLVVGLSGSAPSPLAPR